MKAIKNYYNVVLLYKIDYYKNAIDQDELFNNSANKNEAINILGF